MLLWPVGSRNQQGASLVEFALVFPVFLLLLIGILTYGIAFATQQAVNYAAQRSAESVTNIDPRLDMDVYAMRATGLVNERLSSVLGYFPGVSPSVDTAELGCGNADEMESSSSARLCIQLDDDEDGRRVIIVALAPTFSSLWPGFPETGFVLAPGAIRAVGRTVVSAGNDGTP